MISCKFCLLAACSANTANTIMLKNNLNCLQVRDPDRDPDTHGIGNVGKLDTWDHFVIFSDGETTSWAYFLIKIRYRPKKGFLGPSIFTAFA